MNLKNEELYALLAYLVSSAARLSEEPASYGPMRLIEGAKRLSSVLVESGDEKSSGLKELIHLIEEGRQSSMSDDEAFQNMLDEAVEMLVDII